MILVLACAVVAALFAADRALRRPAHFVTFLLAAGTLKFGAEAGELAGGSIDLSSLWLMWLIALSVLVLLRSRSFSSRLSPPEIAYLLFLGWCVFAASRAASLAFALRMFLKLLYPFLVMVLARTAIRTPADGAHLLRWMIGASAVAFALIGGPTQRFSGELFWSIAPLFWVSAAFADHAAIMTVAALSCWGWLKQRRYLVLGILLATSSLFLSIRTGILATAVGVAFWSVAAYGRRAVPLVVLIGCAGVAGLFLVPEVRAKMFVNPDEGSASTMLDRPDQLSFENIDSSGRFALWEEVLDRFFRPDPLMGSGLGATQAWFYAKPEGVKVEHSEYVRLLSDTGLVGAALYVTAVITSMVSSWRIMRKATDLRTRCIAGIAFATGPAFLVCMGFDNVLNYALPAAQYPFALVGLAIAATCWNGHQDAKSESRCGSPRRSAAPSRRMAPVILVDIR